MLAEQSTVLPASRALPHCCYDRLTCFEEPSQGRVPAAALLAGPVDPIKDHRRVESLTAALAAMVEASMRMPTGGENSSVAMQMARAGMKVSTRQMLKRNREATM